MPKYVVQRFVMDQSLALIHIGVQERALGHVGCNRVLLVMCMSVSVCVNVSQEYQSCDR